MPPLSPPSSQPNRVKLAARARTRHRIVVFFIFNLLPVLADNDVERLIIGHVLTHPAKESLNCKTRSSKSSGLEFEGAFRRTGPVDGAMRGM